MQKGLREKTSDKRKGKETFKGLEEWNREKGNKGHVKVVDLKLYFHCFFQGPTQWTAPTLRRIFQLSMQLQSLMHSCLGGLQLHLFDHILILAPH